MGKRELIQSLLQQGKSSAEIMEELGIPRSTIRYYREPSRAKNNKLRISAHRRKLKRKAIDYSGGKCLKCNYNACDSAMAFHHLDPSKKEKRISCGLTWSWVKAKAEIDKTILLCHNCHAELHADLWELTVPIIENQQSIRISFVDKPLAEYV